MNATHADNDDEYELVQPDPADRFNAPKALPIAYPAKPRIERAVRGVLVFLAVLFTATLTAAATIQPYDADGKPLHVTQLDDDSAAAIVGIKVVTKGNAEMGFGEVTEFKLADKVATLEKAMKYHVLFKEDHKSQADALGEIVLKFVNANKR